MSAKLSLPPDDKSLRKEFERRWKRIIEYWEGGYALEQEVIKLEDDLEFERQSIFENNEKDDEFDWRLDWLNAKRWHEYQLDFVNNRKLEIENLAQFWSSHFNNLQAVGSMVRAEAFKGLLIVNGAAMLTAIAVISGEVEGASFYVKLAAKFILFCSGLSLLSMAVGYGLLHHLAEGVSAEFRRYTLRPFQHSKVKGIDDELREFLGIKPLIINILIYGSVVLFAFGLVSALSILITQA
ncbi:MAG: hypothetical protein JJ979_07435 [Roseibium sp.]|nr:hypothetical protein [Roseibium sp.]